MEQLGAKVLFVNVDKNDHFMLQNLLKAQTKQRYQLTSCYHYEKGLTYALSQTFDIALVDYHLADHTGIEFIQQAIENGCDIPLVLLSSDDEEMLQKSAVDAGSVDFLYKKELSTPLLERVIRYAIERKKNESQLLKINKQLQYLATNDVLTGIANRNQFNNKLPLMVEQCIRNKHMIAIMFLDLDQFKQVNDTLGHSYGDLLLQQVSQRLKDNLRKIDNIFRLGGDEFIIVVAGPINKEHVKKLATKIIKLLAKPFSLQENQWKISTSIGITIATHDSMRSPDQLTKEADIAMYSAKKNGRNNFQFYQDLRKTPPIRPIDQRKTREFSRRGCRKDHLQCSFIYLRWRIFFPTERSHSPPKKVIWPIRILPIFAK